MTAGSRSEGGAFESSDGSTSAESWRTGRADAAAEHLAALGRRRARESEQAADLVRQFVEACRSRRIPAQRLRVTAYDGRTTYRTPLSGWYLKPDRTVAVGTDGAFYVLTAPTSLSARLRGVTPVPEDPPLQVGAGGRDGDSVALDALLALRLAEPID